MYLDGHRFYLKAVPNFFEASTDLLSHPQSRYENVFTLQVKVNRCVRTEFLRIK